MAAQTSSQTSATPSSTTDTTSPTTSSLIPYIFTLSESHSSGFLVTTEINATSTSYDNIGRPSTIVTSFGISTVLSADNLSGAELLGTYTVSQASNSATSGTTSGGTASNTTVAGGSSGTSQPSRSPGLSSGAVAGVAIGTFVLGALIVFLLLTMVHKRNQRRQKRQTVPSALNPSPTARYDEKSAHGAVAPVAQYDSFDIDRLLPQPLDDSTIKSEVKTLFTQIDGHVENFYADGPLSQNTQFSTDQFEARLLANPTTRFFALKRIVCLAMLDAISFECPSERSLLPCRLGSISRQLRDENLDDPANALSWSRLRASIGYLLRSDLGAADQKRIDQAVVTILDRLNARIQPFEQVGSSNARVADLNAICKSSAKLGRLLLSQPAAWKFDWQVTQGNSGNHRAQPIVYFPGLIRLTDNKAKKLRSPYVAFPATTAIL